MSWSKMGVPNPLFDANGDPYSGAVLKAYLPGTTTSTSIAIDSAGSSPQTSVTYNAEGKLEVSGNEIEAYIDRKHKYGIFANATDAAANTPFYMGPFDNVEKVSNASDFSQVFETVAAMVASTTLSVGDYVKTLGYLAIGDGGGNEYDIVAASTGTDDGGTFIDLATHQAKGMFVNGIYYYKQFGPAIDGSTDDSNNFTNFLAAIANKNAVISAASTSSVVAGVFTISSPVTIHAHGATLEWSTNANNQGLKVTSSDVHIVGGDWKGPQFASYDATQIGIWFEGTAPTTYITDCSVKDANIYNWGGKNIRFRVCQDFEATGNHVYDGRANGIEILSCLDGVIHSNTVENFLGDGTPEAWGITLSKNDGAIASWPQTKRVSVTSNVVRDIEVWTGIDTHGGEDITIANNVIFDCLLGITVTRFDDATNFYAPKNVTVTGNVLTNENIAKTTVGNGIQVVGQSSTVTADNIIVTGNTVTNYGKEAGALGTSNFSAGVYLSRYKNLVFSNNIIDNSGTHGLFCDNMGSQLVGSNNIIRTLTDATTGSAIYFDGDTLTADGQLDNTAIDVAGYIGVYVQADTDMNMINTKFQAASTNWSQNGGSLACQYLGRVDPVHIGSATWDPASIASGASSSTSVTAIPGCSSLCVVADIGVNRDLQGMTPHTLTADTDTNTGSFTYYLYNNTSGAIDLASLNILYKIIKPV